MKIARETKAGGSDKRARLREILGILSRNDILHGLTPEKLRRIVEELGPTFVKLGQILSMRRDMLPAAYCRELSKLRADVAPMPFHEVRAVMEAEYGVPLKTLFASVEEKPLGAASIAQAHAAVLRDGRSVVVKVQRPGIRETMAQDIVLLRRAARMLGALSGTGHVIDFRMVLDEMWFVAQQEMDFLIEARNADEFRRLNRDVVYIACPHIDHQHTTARVLTMEYIDGISIDNVDKLRAEGYDLDEIASKLADNFVKQVVDDAFFHADPHPGNLRVRGGQIVYLDMGMMGRLTARDRDCFQKAVQAVAVGDTGTVKDVLLTIGVHSGPIDHARLYADIDDMLGRYGSMRLADMDLSRLLEELLALAGEHHIAMPEGVTMLGRAMVNVQGVLAVLSPDSNLMSIMANHIRGGVLRGFDPQKELESGLRSLTASGRKALDLPAQLSDLLKMAIKGQTKINWELTGSREPLAALDHMVNKLVLCVLIAALLIGSSLLCTVPATVTVLGLPVLAFLGYLAAAVLGGCLLIAVVRRRR